MFFSAIACGLIFFSGTHARHLRHDDTPVPMGGEKARAQNPESENPKGRGSTEQKDGMEKILSSNGTFHTINVVFVYQHVWIDFPDFGKQCTAYINAGGVLVESPYFEGEIQLVVHASRGSTPQQKDDLKGVLCRLMRTGEYKNLVGLGFITVGGYGIYVDDIGEIVLRGIGATIFSMAGGTIRFSGCSC